MVEYGRTALKPVQPTKTFGRGRVCAHEGCETVLSRYNAEDVCFAHRVRKVPVV